MDISERILKLSPKAAIPGGEVMIEGEGFDCTYPTSSFVMFGESKAHLVAASPTRIMAIVPEEAGLGKVDLKVGLHGSDSKATEVYLVGSRLAEELHSVANPAFDPREGSLYVTRSGPRGHQHPVTLFRISVGGRVEEFSGDIINPTGIAFDHSGEMYVTSRLEGIVYHVSHLNVVTEFCKGLGVATGIAFDADGMMYVGDRNGVIYCIDEIGEANEFARLEASVSAYHLAFGPDGYLYVTGPTVSSADVVMRINKAGEAKVFYRGLGRPQGIAFDRAGNLYVAASFQGRRGIVQITPDGKQAELVIAGMNVVGLAFSEAGAVIVATNSDVYRVPLKIYGCLV